MARVYVNQALGSNTGTGSEADPLLTFSAALTSPSNTEIVIDDGVYSESIDSVLFDRVRRKVIGRGDVYFNANGNKSIFTKNPLRNVHLFKNIKFTNYTEEAMQLSNISTFSSCFFSPFVKAGSTAFRIKGPTVIEVRKCTVLNHETIFEIDSKIKINQLTVKLIENSLFHGHDFHMRRIGEVISFTTFLSQEQDKGNYYDNNVHLAYGGQDSMSGENPPLFVNASGGNYDLIPSSSLVGAGYLGSDIGSFHDYTPFSSKTDEIITLFDVGWQNDNRYYNLVTQNVGVDGPLDAAPIIQIQYNNNPRWVLDLANVPAGRSGRLISPVFDLKLVRTITRASWAAEEDATLPSGMKQIISNSNGVTADLEIRGDVSSFSENSTSPVWVSFEKATAIGITVQFVQIRAVFRLDGV